MISLSLDMLSTRRAGSTGAGAPAGCRAAAAGVAGWIPPGDDTNPTSRRQAYGDRSPGLWRPCGYEGPDRIGGAEAVTVQAIRPRASSHARRCGDAELRKGHEYEIDPDVIAVRQPSKPW